ncbi:MAG: hypothetical protein IPI64_14655 [Chloracidobacterium sp.]|nr:hypothetical protein [Chloracidobacterium sp.]
MANSTAFSKLAGGISSLLAVVGVIAFFVGIFGGPRSFAFGGLALIVASLVGYFIEEQANRRA